MAPVPGRMAPRWSTPFTGGLTQTDSSPALTAGLPASSAMVRVGPPLFASPLASCGVVLQNELPLVLVQPVPVKPHVVPSSMLWPPSVIVPAQLPPEVPLATMVLVTVSVPAFEMPPAPAGALLLEKVLLMTVTVPP